MLEKGQTPTQETRGWDSEKGITYSQRVKEGAADYRYFPEPDIPPFTFTDSYIESIAQLIPELPKKRMERLIASSWLKPLDAYLITRDKDISDLFEQVLIQVQKMSTGKVDAQRVASALINKRLNISSSPESVAKKYIEITTPQETDTEVLAIVVKSVLSTNEKAVAEYKSGKGTVIMFLVGQVMKQMKGKADAGTVRKALEERIFEPGSPSSRG